MRAAIQKFTQSHPILLLVLLPMAASGSARVLHTRVLLRCNIGPREPCSCLRCARKKASFVKLSDEISLQKSSPQLQFKIAPNVEVRDIVDAPFQKNAKLKRSFARAVPTRQQEPESFNHVVPAQVPLRFGFVSFSSDKQIKTKLKLLHTFRGFVCNLCDKLGQRPNSKTARLLYKSHFPKTALFFDL